MPAVSSFEKVEAVTPPQESEENRVVFDLTDTINDIVVNESVELVPITQLTEKGIVRYSLEEFTDSETNAESNNFETVASIEEPVAEELKITMKVDTDERVEVVSNNFDDISPLELTIEALKHRTDDRRKKMKQFNYNFTSKALKIDEMEKEPAYKRIGYDISNNAQSNSNSRMSLGIDSNEDTQLRTNNSFLHDNVD